MSAEPRACNRPRPVQPQLLQAALELDHEQARRVARGDVLAAAGAERVVLVPQLDLRRRPRPTVEVGERDAVEVTGSEPLTVQEPSLRVPGLRPNLHIAPRP